MKAVGVIVEYNPFHNGHAFHLEQSKEISKSDVVIAVMSGNFLQRGEPALVSKWVRTKMALTAGVDIVFELPYKFATQKAETFANGAISILGAACCDAICFGSEAGNLDPFLNTLDFLEKHHEEFQKNIKLLINKGVSYPRAASEAFQAMAINENMIDLSKPNNILGFHYIKAIHEQKQSLKALTVPRKNANYHDEHFSTETIASATSIRKALFSDHDDLYSIERLVPKTTFDFLMEYKKEIGVFHQWESYWPLLKYRLMSLSSYELRNIYEMEEGIENRILAAGLKSSSYSEFMNQLKTKRYTWTRLQRMCTHILTNTKKEEMKMKEEKATYLRLLGMTEKGREYLHKRKDDLQLPLISKLSSYQNSDIQLDIKAARIFSLGAPDQLRQKLIEKEFSQPPIFITSN